MNEPYELDLTLFTTEKPARKKLGPMEERGVRELRGVMTQKQAARLLQISVSTVGRMMRGKR